MVTHAEIAKNLRKVSVDNHSQWESMKYLPILLSALHEKFLTARRVMSRQ